LEKLNFDIVIFGAGISGLFLHNSLKSQGYNSLLISKGPIGGTQTLTSQGMIHGGQRYAIKGTKNNPSSIALMPKRWEDCLSGKDIPNLKNTNILSSNQYMFASSGLGGKLTTFFATKAMKAKVELLKKENEFPDLFIEHNKTKEKLYKMYESVLDIKDIVKKLIDNFSDSIICTDKINYNYIDNKSLESVDILFNNKEINIKAESYIFSAGEGNKEIADKVSDKQLTQIRPLKQVLVKSLKHSFYGHCITTDPRPRMTISAHPYKEGFVWYLGGLVATKGVDLSDLDTIKFAKKELESIFPWINWEDKEWSTVYVNRAEPATETLKFLPTTPIIKEFNNIILAWPTKLTFAPALCDMVINKINNLNIIKTESDISSFNFKSTHIISNYPWEDANWNRV